MARGPTPEDSKEFNAKTFRVLASAAQDLRMLLDRGYGMNASLKLVGDHFRLTKRQRQFLFRSVTPHKEARLRLNKRVSPPDLRDRHLLMDGHNCLFITECCLAGGIVMLTDDGVLRDIQELHGAFRHSANTEEALDRLNAVLTEASPAFVTLYLDEKMESARQTEEMCKHKLAATELRYDICRVKKTDYHLQQEQSGCIVATNDREAMDRADAFVDLPRAVADIKSPRPYIVLAEHTDADSENY